MVNCVNSECKNYNEHDEYNCDLHYLPHLVCNMYMPEGAADDNN